MRISEIFCSLQGEGINAGKRAIFVRFFGCNLSCSWCDTKYSWHPKHARFQEMSLAEICEKIMGYHVSHIIFTGGEPALYQKDIEKIIQELPETFTYEIESNGTIPLTAVDDLLSTVTISPKLKNSGCKSELKALGDNYFYKFVITEPQDIVEVQELQKKYGLRQVLLMPQGQTRSEQLRNIPRVRALCMQYGFQFSPRLHTLIWDNTPGK
jgi:7-carboxy-7-deazaguanine synthase